jgi:hypothetical protein
MRTEAQFRRRTAVLEMVAVVFLGGGRGEEVPPALFGGMSRLPHAANLRAVHRHAHGDELGEAVSKGSHLQ